MHIIDIKKSIALEKRGDMSYCCWCCSCCWYSSQLSAVNILQHIFSLNHNNFLQNLPVWKYHLLTLRMTSRRQLMKNALVTNGNLVLITNTETQELLKLSTLPTLQATKSQLSLLPPLNPAINHSTTYFLLFRFHYFSHQPDFIYKKNFLKKHEKGNTTYYF